MISKGFLYHMVRVKDLDSEIHPIESVPVMSVFSKVLPNDHPSIHPEGEIDFCIDFLPGTYPICIPFYQMTLAELKE